MLSDKQLHLTPAQAREMEKQYHLEYVSLNANGTAIYNVTEKTNEGSSL